MTKTTISDLDQKIATFMGWKTAHPFSTSDTYIGIVKRYFEKLKLSWSLRYHYKHAGLPYMCMIRTDNPPIGEADNENMAVCLAFEKYIDAVTKQ